MTLEALGSAPLAVYGDETLDFLLCAGAFFS